LEAKKNEVEGIRECFACGKAVPNPKEGNYLDDEIICDSCREEMISSLEDAWVKQSAFLDSALN
jgi:formylmethanofuran dehydrogenase subunit E